MGGYLGAVWKCRYFWLSLVKMDLRARYRGSVLGIGWSLLHPIAMTAIICTVFSTIFNADIHSYAPFLMAGLTLWNYVLSTALSGSQCFFQAEAYIRQYPAPMAIYPLRTTLGSAFHFGLSLLLVVLLGAVLRGLPPPLALLAPEQGGRGGERHQHGQAGRAVGVQGGDAAVEDRLAEQAQDRHQRVDVQQQAQAAARQHLRLVDDRSEVEERLEA